MRGGDVDTGESLELLFSQESPSMRAIALFALCLLPSFGSQSPAGSAGRSLSYRGCGIVKHAFMRDAADVYQAQTGVVVTVSGGGATLGIESAGEGGSDIGGTCRHCLPIAPEKNLPIALTIVAWDAIAVVAHPSNPLAGLCTDDLRRVLLQEITNWSELGGADLPIVVVARKGKTSGVGAMLRELIFGDANFEFGPRVIRLQSSGPVEQLVEKVPGALALSGVSSSRRRAVKHLKLNGAAPTRENIASGEYPYYRPLYIAHAPDLEGEAALFRSWLLGSEGQQVIQAAGTVNLQAGLGLMGSFEAFGETEQISNYQELMERWRVEEALQRGRLPKGK